MAVEPGQQGNAETSDQQIDEYWGEVATGSRLPPEDFLVTQVAPSQQGAEK